MYIKTTENTHLTESKNTLKMYNKRVMENCLQMYSPYNAQFRIVAANGFRREVENINLVYDKLVYENAWIVKYCNSNDGKINYKWYETKKEAQTFIRGRKRRMKERVKKLQNWLFEELFFEFDESR